MLIKYVLGYMRETDIGGVVMNFLLVLRSMFSVIKTCCRVVRYHPSVMFVVLFFYLLYRFVPSVFNLLLSSFPLFTCTVALIASLVALGHGSDTRQTSRAAVDAQKEPESKHVKDEPPMIVKAETTNAASATDTNEKAIGSIKSAGPMSRRQKSKKRVSFSPINFESSVRNATTTECISTEILQDGKLETDKPTGETSDYASDSSQDPSLKRNRGVAESSCSGSVSNASSGHAESSSSNADINPVMTDAPSQPVLYDGAPEESDRSNEDGFESEAEKNLMDLGESEIERNQRLESLMARRRARKKMLRMVAEKNLIDLGHNEPPIHIAPLTVIKNNPFDHTAENEIPGLPPVPGSAPSVLVPRANPFDLPYDPQEERPNLTGDSFHEEFMNVIQKDIFCRHESFCYGSTSYSGGLKQDKSDNHVRSYSVIEDMGSPGQRQMCAPSDSTSSLGAQIELRSLVPEDQMKPMEEQSAQAIEAADVVEIHQEERNETCIKPDIVEIQSPAIEPYRDDSKEGPSSTFKDSDLKSGMTVEATDTSETYEPVYDSSPSAIEKRTIEESLFCEDKGVVLTTVLSIASDMHVEVSEATSPSASSERQPAFTDEELRNYNENVRSSNSSVGEDLWAASPDLHTVDETKAKSNGVAEISDLDVINAGLFGTCTDANTGIPIEQQPVLNPVTSNPPSCPSETASKIEGLVSQASSSSTEPEADGARVPRGDWKENVASSSSARQLPHESLTVQQSRDGDHRNEKQGVSFESAEEENTINNVKDPPAVEYSCTTSSLTCEPLNGHQNPLPSTEPGMHNKQLVMEENAEPNAPSSSLSQVPSEEFGFQSPMDNDRHQEAMEPTTEYMEDGDIIKDSNDSVSTKLEENVDPEEGSSSSVAQFASEKSAVHPSMDQHGMHPVTTDSDSTSSATNEPIKEGLMNCDPSSSAEQEMHNQDRQVNLEENVEQTVSAGSSLSQVPVGSSMVEPLVDSDHHEATQESSMQSPGEDNIINDVKDPIIVEEEKPKTVQKLIEHHVDFPETTLESGASSVDHPIKDTHVAAGTPGTQADADEEDEIQLTAGTLLESATASSADQFDDLGTNNLQKMMASRIKKQNFEANAGLNIETLHNQPDEQKVDELAPGSKLDSAVVTFTDDHLNNGETRKITDGGATVDSGTVSSYDDAHTNDRGNAAVQEQGIDAYCNQESHETMETGAQQNQDFEADQGEEKERTGNLHNEKDAARLKPNTMRESGAVSSAGHCDEHESGTQSKQDFVANPDIEKETPLHLHNEQQTVCLIPESSNPDFDHGSSKLLGALESDFNQKEVAIHENPMHRKSNTENGSLQKNMAFGGNFPLKNIIFKNMMEEEVWLTPKTTLEAITPRAPMTPRAVELEHRYLRNHHPNDHGPSSNVAEMMENEAQEEAYEPSKHLQITEEVSILESVHHGRENQDFDEKCTSKPQQNEEDIHSPQQVTSDITQLEESGGDVMSCTMESGPAKELRFEPSNLSNIIYKNLQQEEEIWSTPRTAAADPYYHNYNGSSSAQTFTSTAAMRKMVSDSAEAEKKVDSDEGDHLYPEENETSDSKTLEYHEKVVDDKNADSATVKENADE